MNMNKNENPRPRAYVVGLPVSVEVGPEGHLIIAVDTSELPSAIWDDYGTGDNEYTEDEMTADAEAITAALENRRYRCTTMWEE